MKRNKKRIIKFLEIDQLEQLQRPLLEKARTALAKSKLNFKDKIAIRDMAVLTLVYSCALRISEATHLLLINIDLERQYIRVCDSKGDDRMVYVPDATINVLRKWLEVRPQNKNPYFFCHVKGSTRTDKAGEFRVDDRPLDRGYYNDLINRLAEQTGIKLAGGSELSNPTPHTLRHTRAMEYMDAGVDLDVIQKILGHKNIATTQVYASVRQEAADNVQKQITANIASL